MLVDSHCHLDRLDLAPYEGKLSGALDAARANGVEHMLCVAIDLEAYPAMLALVENVADVSVSVGVHPNEHGGRAPTVEELVQLAQHPKVVAIGETGLDYFRSEGDLDWQRDYFRRHIAAAKAARKPLIIHSREARADTLRLLREEDAAAVGGVMHCFTEDWEMAQAAMEMNFYISFSGIVTFKTATQLQDVARRMPLDRMLVETDSPYLAPVPFRGKPNQPAYVRQVAEFVAQLRGVDLETICHATTRNFYTLFKPGLTAGSGN
ncbi:MAG: TatD family hydrolase [Gammaproteobacteria bacterium]